MVPEYTIKGKMIHWREMNRDANNGWNPLFPDDWARRFGFVASPLFPPNSIRAATQGSVLRDGRLLSFTLLEETVAEKDQEALSWSWSAHTRYLLRPRFTAGKFFIHRWDQPFKPFEEFSLDGVRNRPDQVIDLLRRDMPAREQDAVDHVIQVFRSLRSRVVDSETAIRLLHHLLRPEDNIGEPGQNSEVWSRADVAGLRDRLLGGNQRLGLPLYPELLLRHAAAELFQEAHVEADRQIYFFGMSPPGRIDKLPPEVRYTPAHLARVLGEVAFSKLRPQHTHVRVLDPACGSGVFLTEVESLNVGGGRPKLELRGYDTSTIAVELAQSCIALAASTDQTENVDRVIIEKRDSLAEDWGIADIILMNPPFRAYPDMDVKEPSAAIAALGRNQS
jgi:adenine-specific DNA-methyltransferase